MARGFFLKYDCLIPFAGLDCGICSLLFRPGLRPFFFPFPCFSFFCYVLFGWLGLWISVFFSHFVLALSLLLFLSQVAICFASLVTSLKVSNLSVYSSLEIFLLTFLKE